MRVTTVENLALALATLVLGLMAGFFTTYTINVSLALSQVDGPTYAVVQSLLNQSVRQPIFGALFFGGAVVLALALGMNWRHAASAPFGLLALAILLYLSGVIVYTAQVHLPLNMYTESWDPQALPSDWAATRSAWNRANLVRTTAAGLTFLLTLSALALRAQPGPAPAEVEQPDDTFRNATTDDTRRSI